MKSSKVTARFLLKSICLVLVSSWVTGCSIFTSSKHSNFYERHLEQVKSNPAKIHLGNLLWPVTDGKLSSRYGMRNGRFHDGLDIVKFKGAPILATHDGKIIRADSRFSGYGNLIVLKGQDIITMYAHLDKFNVNYGDIIYKGDILGTLGATGRATAPHLHYETRIMDSNNRYTPIDPLVFYDR